MGSVIPVRAWAVVLAACLGAACAPSPTCPSSADARADEDADGVCDAIDACAGHPDGEDADEDGVPDGCDGCRLDPSGDQDADGDGVCDESDACVGDDRILDADGDGVCDDLNAPPSAPIVAIAPASPTPDDELWCEVRTDATDPEGRAISYTFDWQVDGAPYTGPTTDKVHVGDAIPAAETALDEEWSCTATASDGNMEGPPSATSTVWVSFPDADGDGATSDVDCDDTDPLVLDAPLPAGSAAWASLTLWLDADDPASLDVVGSGVSAWRSRAGFSAQFEPVDLPPTLTTLAGRTAVAFADSPMDMGTVWRDDLFSADAVDIFVVERQPANQSNKAILEWGGLGDRLAFFATHGLTTPEFIFDMGGSSAGRLRVLAPPAFSGPVRLVEFARLGSTSEIYLDGARFASGAVSALLPDVAYTLYLGRGDASNAVTGTVGEVLVFDARLDDADRVYVQSYLACRWQP